jgi:nicotinate-nucleotide pyrophosphorylase (carboxylating)
MLISQDLKNHIDASIKLALMEDLNGPDGSDITAELIPEHTQASAKLISREQAVICGIPWVTETFNSLNPTLELQWHIKEGERVKPDQCLLTIKGNARSILTGERTAMNFLQTLSGTATITAEYVNQIKDTHCQLLDTRKTIPGLRLAQKYAVKVGGGENHRIGLFDAFLIKENHIATAGGIAEAVQKARANHPSIKLEVEVETLEELSQALDAGSDVVMLDNFNFEQMAQAVKLNASHVSPAKLEASGDVTLEKLQSIANTGVDYISVGALTKHVRAVDLSLRVNLKN